MKKVCGLLLFVCVAMIACAGCSPEESSTEQYGRKPDAYVPPPVDAPAPGTAGWASCWNSGNANAACNLSTQFCCFDEINSPNWGWCVNTSAGVPGDCTRSWNLCDGNEDCNTAAGERCNEALVPSTLYPPALVFDIRCTATWGSNDHQMCHGPGDTSCPSGTTCTLGESASPGPGYFGMPPNMYVCW